MRDMPSLSSLWRWSDLDLADYAGGSPSDVPNSPGVYVWRLKCGEELDPSLPMSEFLDKLQRNLERPSGLLPTTQLGTTVRIGEIAIGGGQLTTEKVKFLTDQFGNANARRALAGYCHALDRFAPILYIGKSMHLKTRLADHVNGQTDLKEYVYGSLKRQWRDLAVSYLLLPSELVVDRDRADQLLSTLEMIAQLVLAPHGVRRRG
jgi:hypothetical protein